MLFTVALPEFAGERATSQGTTLLTFSIWGTASAASSFRSEGDRRGTRCTWRWTSRLRQLRE